jgi:lipoprotein-releasing system ATP-binding protein
VNNKELQFAVLANKPRIILADEPTGNLDQKTTLSVFESLVTIVKQTNLSALIATHNLDLANRMDRVVKLIDGKIS